MRPMDLGKATTVSITQEGTIITDMRLDEKWD